jgi:hypothetical protein
MKGIDVVSYHLLGAPAEDKSTRRVQVWSAAAKQACSVNSVELVSEEGNQWHVWRTLSVN